MTDLFVLAAFFVMILVALGPVAMIARTLVWWDRRRELKRYNQTRKG